MEFPRGARFTPPKRPARIAGGSGTTLSDLVGRIKAQRQHGNLSSALRLFVLEYYRGKAEELKNELGGEQSAPPHGLS